jgi:ABC-2 type transport system permease protein
MAPPLLFVFLNLDTLNSHSISSEWYITRASWYLSYLALSVSLFGFSMYLVGRRESGFIKTFIHGKKAKILFISSQIQASIILSFFYFIIFITLTTTAFGVDTLDAFAKLALPFIVVIILFIWSAQFISAIPITFTNANSSISILFMTILIFSAAGLNGSVPAISYINLFNPLSIATKFMSDGKVEFTESIITIIVMVALGCVGSVYMRTNPIWSRQ